MRGFSELPAAGNARQAEGTGPAGCPAPLPVEMHRNGKSQVPGREALPKPPVQGLRQVDGWRREALCASLGGAGALKVVLEGWEQQERGPAPGTQRL